MTYYRQNRIGIQQSIGSVVYVAVMTFFRRFSKTSSALAVVLLALAGCATATIDNAVPTSAQATAQDPMPAPAQAGGAAAFPEGPQTATLAVAPEDKPVPPRSGAPINTGSYPNINVVPEGQTSQLSNAESANLRSSLYAEQAAQRLPGEPVEAYIARLRKLQSLGSTHAAAALKQIEASQ